MAANRSASRTPSRRAAPRGGPAPAMKATRGSRPRADVWDLRLYVAGQTPRSLAALRNLRQICDEHLPGKYHIEVVDLLEHPKLAVDDQIVAIPTLVRKLPPPIRKIVGDLSDRIPVLVGLQLRPRD